MPPDDSPSGPQALPIRPTAKNPDIRVEIPEGCKEYIFSWYTQHGQRFVETNRHLGRWGHNAIIFPWYVGALVLQHARDCQYVVEFVPPEPPVRHFVRY